MTQLILNIKNANKLPFLKELLKHMEFVEVIDPAENKKLTLKEKKILKELEDAVVQVNLHKQGKIKLKSIQQVLNEL